MKKMLAILFSAITVLFCTVPVFAEPTTETEIMSEITNPVEVTAITEENITGETEISIADITENTTVAPEESTTNPETTPSIIKGYGYVSFSLNDVKTNITMIIADEKGKEYSLEFKAEDNYIVQGSYPVGKYTIKSVKSQNDDYKIKDYHLMDSDSTTFTVTETDFMSVKFTVTEKKELFIVGFLKREWYLLVILVGLVVAYWYKKTHRILPSQES